MASAREWVLKIVGDTSGVERSFKDVESKAGGWKDTAKGVGAAIGTAFAVDKAVDFGKTIINAASDTEQAVGAVGSVFKDYAGQIETFGETTADKLGLSKQQFLELATISGALLKNAGLPMETVTKNTEDLTARAADMAAMFGGPVSDAMGAINSALKGETDPIEKYGVSIKDTQVKAKALAMGLVDAEGNVTDQGKTMARVALIMDQSADAAGTFAEESGSLAGQTAIMKAQFADFESDLGTKLLPTFVKLSRVLMDTVGFVTKNQSWLLPLAASIGAVVVAVKGYQAVTMAMQVATKLWAAAQMVLNAAMYANPIGLIVAAVVALIAVFVLAYMKVDWFRDAVDAAVRAIVAAFQWVVDAIKTAMQWLWDFLQSYLDFWIGIWEEVIGVFETVKDAIIGFIKFNVDEWAPLFEIITKPFIAAWKFIIDAAGKLIDFFVTWGIRYLELITWPHRMAINLIMSHWDQIMSVLRRAVDIGRTIVEAWWNIISWPFERGIQLATWYISTLQSVISRVGGWIRDAFAYVEEIITAPFRNAFNAIKRLWNSTIGGFGFSVPSWIPYAGGNEFRIPMMAAGGIVRRPTLAVIGEAGPEAVVPLSGASGSLTGVTVNVYALTANAEVGRRVIEALREYERTSGTTAMYSSPSLAKAY